MEHYKSTFATIGVAVTGLVLAAQVMQTGPFTPDAGRPERVRVEASSETAAWADPPARAPVAMIARAEPAAAPPQVTADAPLPLIPAAMPAPVPAAPAAQAPAPRKASAPHKRKVAQRAAQRAALTRQAGLAPQGPAPAAAPQVATAPAPAQENRVDPIGDLIRGLGFGGDRQG